MKKKILAVMLSAVMAVAVLAGCGDSVETGGRAERKERKTTREQETDNPETDNPEAGNVGFWEKGSDVEEITVLVKAIDRLNGPMIEFEYDAYGNQVKKIWYNSDGSIAGWNEYEYDMSRNVLKVTEYNSDGSILDSFEREFSEQPAIFNFNNKTFSSADRWQITEEYDASGNLTKETWYDFDDNIVGWVEYEYNTSGNKTKEIKYDSHNSILYSQEIKYDMSGNITKEILFSYNKEDIIFEEPGDTFDRAGGSRFLPNQQSNTRREDIDSNEEGYSCEKEYEYDASGNRTKEIIYEEGRIMYWCEYDTFGNTTKEMKYNSDSSIIQWYEYEYKTIMLKR